MKCRNKQQRRRNRGQDQVPATSPGGTCLWLRWRPAWTARACAGSYLDLGNLSSRHCCRPVGRAPERVHQSGQLREGRVPRADILVVAMKPGNAGGFLVENGLVSGARRQGRGAALRKLPARQPALTKTERQLLGVTARAARLPKERNMFANINRYLRQRSRTVGVNNGSRVDSPFERTIQSADPGQ
jgi:hypothetical protein